jgi:hypothetical protein
MRSRGGENSALGEVHDDGVPWVDDAQFARLTAVAAMIAWIVVTAMAVLRSQVGPRLTLDEHLSGQPLANIHAPVYKRSSRQTVV